MFKKYEYLERKAAQAWELAALARQDGDKVDELRWINEAQEYDKQIREGQ